MPDPSTQNQNNQNPTAAPAVTPVSPQPNDSSSMPMHTDLPPLPDFMTQGSAPPTSPTIPTSPTVTTTDDSNGSAAPSDLPPMTITPKKKFGGKKIIATILGIFLLVGGVGAGLILTQQSQIFQPKAVKTNPDDIGNPSQRIAQGGGNGGSGANNTTQAGSGTAVDHGVVATGGKTCADYGSADTRNSCFAAAAADAQKALLPAGVPSVCDCPGCTTGAQAHAAGCQTGQYIGGSGQIYCSNCSNDGHETICAQGYVPSGGTCNQATGTGGGGGTTTTTTTDTAQCSNVQAYSATWTLLTPANLSTLSSGTVVNFCVAGTASSGTFDKAQFKINTTVEPETTTVRPSSTDFCQSYTILPTDTTVNVLGKIHHATLGWEGSSF